MSLAATPRAFSVAVTRFTAWLASCSADPTDEALTWTPIDRISWLGVPLTVPVPVTVIRADPPDEASARPWVRDELCPADDGEALPAVMPSANAPIKMAAAAPPNASAR